MKSDRAETVSQNCPKCKPFIDGLSTYDPIQIKVNFSLLKQFEAWV